MSLETDPLTINYGQLSAIRQVPVRVEKGSCLAVVGPNGAGKSTLLKGLIGLTDVAEGDIRLHGTVINKQSIRSRMRRGLTLVPEGRMVIGGLTVADNLQLGAVAHGWKAPSAERIAEVLDVVPDLKTRLTRHAGHLSGGEQQMLAIARALLARPSVLLLDEPSLGLAPVAIGRVLQALHTMKESGLTLVVVEQNARVALEIADSATVLVAGRRVFAGKPEDLTAHGVLAELYLHAPAHHDEEDPRDA